MSEPPEVNFARRLIDREKLKPPIDVAAIAMKFARIERLEFPMDLDIDGICLNLKRRGRIPYIIVNIAKRTNKRIRFTLAHELGHVIIPWHTGSIIDAIDIDQSRADLDYWRIESEANRFAAELLMPAQWVKEKIEEFPSPVGAIEHVASSAEVSRQAAMIRVNAYQRPGIVYAQVQNGIVVASGRSNGTVASPPQSGTSIDPRSLFPWTPHRWETQIGETRCFWWQFKGDVTLPTEYANEDWQMLLRKIINDIKLPGNEVAQFKSRVNGVIGFINGHGRRKIDRTVSKIFEACLERFHSKAMEDNSIRLMVQHPLFHQFIYARVLELMK